jgi:hypothetical protein
MKTFHKNGKHGEQAYLMMAFLLVMLIVSVSVAAMCAYMSTSTTMAQRSTWMVDAQQYAQSAAVIAARDLNTAVTNPSIGTLGTKLTSISYAPYVLVGNLGNGNSNVYQRTIAAGAPFTNQTATVQIWLTNSSQPPGAQIVTSATVGPVTQTATFNVGISFGYGTAILSVNDGTTDKSASKSVAQAGNVVINGSGSGSNYAMVVYGGTNGLAAWANGMVNISTTNTSVVDVAANSVSSTNSSAGTPIPDYTSQGTTNTLFDISRYVAVANGTSEPSTLNPNGNNHYTNLATFISAVNRSTNAATALQGVVVVDVSQGDPDMGNFKTQNIPDGINVEGSLIFNFLGTGWNPTTSKIVIDTPVNINPANLSGLVPGDPSTYTSGYPPTYADPSKDPANINISPTHQNFTSGDDLPALIYTIGVVDLHNSLNISGAMYTPSYMEIENKHSGDIQYMSGELIMGNGIYYENTSKAVSIITYDPNAVRNLATAGTAGKRVLAQYWQ